MTSDPDIYPATELLIDRDGKEAGFVAARRSSAAPLPE
jgi:hypothetical protein